MIPDSVLAEPGVSKPDPVVVVENLTRSFGGLRAVDVNHLEIQRNTITSLIGPNGAGKTTLFNLMSGFDEADSGKVSFDGKNLIGVPSYKGVAAWCGSHVPAHQVLVPSNGAREHDVWRAG